MIRERVLWCNKYPFPATKGEPTCNFEDEHICEWSQDKTDDYDWIRKTGSTQTIKTGPDNDHTYGKTKTGIKQTHIR